MSYVLDGIPTAILTDHDRWAKRFTCPCGFRITWSEPDGGQRSDGMVALRFHYTHCPKAKAPRRDES